MLHLNNFTYNEISLGQHASLAKTITMQDIQHFGVVIGDLNPVHIMPTYADNTKFHGVIAHGMWGASLLSTILGTKFPGPGTIYLSQTLEFKRPVRPGDTITADVEVISLEPEKHIVTLKCICTNQKGATVIEGTAQVIAPEEKVSIDIPDLNWHCSEGR